ncbi:MAG: endonuclease/exonuclease/phosphatase family protein, partial [Candidatus Thiodiazotropha sp.]
MTESWLDSSIRDSELTIPGMHIYRNDRRNGRGGGSAIYVATTLRTSSVHASALCELPESVWLTIHTAPSTNCLLGVIYRSPSADTYFDSKLKQCLDTISSLGYDQTLIMGDFNHPQINFAEGKVNGSKDSPACLFYESVIEAGLFEQVQTYTRWRDGVQPSRLDYILTSEQYMVERLSVDCPLGRSDHCTITFQWITQVTLTIPERRYLRNYNKANYHAIKTHLAHIDWPLDVMQLSLESHWEFIIQQLNAVVELYVPVYNPRVRTKNPIRSSTKKLIATKRLAWNKYKQSPTAESWTNYVRLRNQTVACVRQDKREAQQLFAKSIRRNPKLFFKTLSVHSKSRVGISSI